MRTMRFSKYIDISLHAAHLSPCCTEISSYKLCHCILNTAVARAAKYLCAFHLLIVSIPSPPDHRGMRYCNK
jgi:hypothetical protein